MAGQDQFLLEGGMPNPGLTVSATGLGGVRTDNSLPGSGYQPHHGVLGMVLIAVVGLWALHKFGFRFAVTAGRR